MSVACFSAGLILFTYATDQGFVTSTITTVFTAVTPSAWLPSPLGSPQNAGYSFSIAEGPQMLEISHHHEPALSMCSEYTERPNSLDAPASEETKSSRRSIARQRFKGAVRSVIMMQQQQAGQVPLYLRPFMPPRTPSFDRNSTAGMSPTRFSSIGLNTIQGQRVSMLIPKLRTLEPIQDLSIHTALVQHLQFSPNGKYLATSSWDRSSIIFRVGESFSTQAVLVHVRGFIGQVAWSATGTILLTRLTRGIKVWTEDGLSKRTIDRPHSVSSIAWLPNSDTHFFSVEGSDDIQGKVLDLYHFGRIQLHNVAVTPDGQRLLGVGPLLAAPNGLHPSRTTRIEKRIIVFDIETKQFEVYDFGDGPKINERCCEQQEVEKLTGVVRTLCDRVRLSLSSLLHYENTGAPGRYVPSFGLQKRVAPALPINITGLTNGGNEQRENAACAIDGPPLDEDSRQPPTQHTSRKRRQFRLPS
ncbi:hypothetical protein C8R48DRAFT_778116 [Suillus tomentosus]|nr:hypothetical protein C8R48DRAFT_778116 [Suillus tomentosus]